MSFERAIPKGSTILVTGANGYIGSHVADQLLEAGYKVKGAVRSEDKGRMISETFTRRHGDTDAFSYVVVEDMSTENAFQDAMKGCSGVAHVASDLSFREDPNLVIPPVVTGVKNALKAAAATPSVKRFVLTSSSEALATVEPNTKYHLDRNTWNDIAVKEAWMTEGYDQGKHGMYIYAASKVEGERAAWNFVETEKPGFVLNTILPNYNIGEILDKRQRGSSASQIKGMWEGDLKAIEFMKNFLPQYIINVRDDARLHVAGLIMEDVQGERLLAFNEPASYSRWCEAIRNVDPAKSFPQPPENEMKNLSTVDTDRSVELLKRFGQPGLTSLEDSIRQLVANL